MINIPPGRNLNYQIPNHDPLQREQWIARLTEIINQSVPFVDNIQFINKTKTCMIQVSFNRGTMTIFLTNPNDEVFDLNKLENPSAETPNPITITGR